MPQRSYKIEFFQLSITPNQDVSSIRDLFQALSDEEYETSFEIGGFTREVWGLVFDRFDDSVCGQFRKFRNTDIPEIGSIGEDGEEIELEDDEGLIEKNFFVYYEENDILAWHKNTHSSGVNQFVNFLSSTAGLKIKAGPILQSDAIARLMSGDVELKKIEITLPRPTNPQLYPQDDFGSSILEMMNNADADSLKISMGVDMRRTDTEGRLTGRLKQTLRNLVRNGASTARAHVFDDGVEYPIDLIADRVFSWQSVETNAHFPPNLTMYGMIDTAKAERQEELDGYFGAMEDALL
ncbi:DUF6731 family protein [Scandinavium goeteborgense]|uniref:DUF6731 family protein n=1 Tax=Scandinavium goeteborgense TaxID=1851514 RepID=UPI001574B46F|nr:DUF6731 family protein [Scandinavium goeteborgense]QKN80772.1 hypothetical protein A8O29_005530 [Scandinavium goeteborgense]